MDSLLANYASSDDDDDNDNNHQTLDRKPNSGAGASLFASLPPPSGGLTSTAAAHRPSSTEKKGTIFPTIDPSLEPSNTKGSIFAALPPPKPKNPRRVVQFRPPIDLSVLKKSNFDDEDEDDEDEVKKRKIDQVSTKSVSGSSYSSLLPAPKNSFGLGSSLGSGSSRISGLDAVVASEKASSLPFEQDSHSGGGWTGNETEDVVGEATGSELHMDGNVSGYYSTAAEASTYSEYASAGTEASGWDPNYGGYVGYEGYEGSSTYESMPATISEVVPDMGRIGGKRGRNGIPEIVEVKQDELMKNRPRQDQAKLTGIAFGPSYQAAPSAKGKPSKLHKRKHQIGSLFFDMKQKEMELAERRSRGLLTKAQTQGKYGW